MAAYDPIYERSLNTGVGELKTNLLGELRAYLGLSESDDELYSKCRKGTEAILAEWRGKKIDPSNRDEVTKFYVDTKLYCYELLALELDAPEERQKQLKLFADFLKGENKLVGCDYGSGIGTLGIYLNRNGLRCDFADVSETNLEFIGQRLERRGLRAPRRINLTREKLADASYDFITAFDVLEHVTDPLALIGEISSKLKSGGYFIFNVLCEEEHDTPHLLRDPNLIRKNIRGFGLTKETSFGEFKVYRKVERPEFANALVRGADRVFWDVRERLRSIAGR
jgi:SAM-dependent methyltransferase